MWGQFKQIYRSANTEIGCGIADTCIVNKLVKDIAQAVCIGLYLNET